MSVLGSCLRASDSLCSPSPCSPSGSAYGATTADSGTAPSSSAARGVGQHLFYVSLDLSWAAEIEARSQFAYRHVWRRYKRCKSYERNWTGPLYTVYHFFFANSQDFSILTHTNECDQKKSGVFRSPAQVGYHRRPSAVHGAANSIMDPTPIWRAGAFVTSVAGALHTRRGILSDPFHYTSVRFPFSRVRARYGALFPRVVCMSESIFRGLVDVLRPRLPRRGFSAEMRAAMALRYLSGGSYMDICASFGAHPATR